MKHTLWNIVTDLKNAQISQRNFMYFRKTKLIINFLNILWNEGYIIGYKVCNIDSSLLKIFLKYKNKDSVIDSLRFISKPSRSMFYSSSQLCKLNPKNLMIFSTSKGLLTINECKQAQIGGKLLFFVR